MPKGQQMHRFTLLVLILAAISGCASRLVPYREIGDSVVVIGELGLPLGGEAIIEGVFEKNIMVPAGYFNFRVDTVNGQKLAPTTTIYVTGNVPSDHKPGTHATLHGSERGTVSYRPMMNYESMDDPRFIRGQELETAFVIGAGLNDLKREIPYWPALKNQSEQKFVPHGKKVKDVLAYYDLSLSQMRFEDEPPGILRSLSIENIGKYKSLRIYLKRNDLLFSDTLSWDYSIIMETSVNDVEENKPPRWP
jgi:hypothetical protein